MKIFHSMQVNGKTIDWERLSGNALGVQKYTKTHVSGGGENSSVSSRIETITEFDVVKQNGQEVHVKISGDRVRVRDGQIVSVLSCHNQKKSLTNCIFINHNSQEWYWLLRGGHWGFLLPLEIFSFPKKWLIINLSLSGISLITLFSAILLVYDKFIFSIFISFFVVALVSFIAQFVVMQIVLSPPWKNMQPEVEKMVQSIM
jgi:hypothetical protein